jgi:hypothetical protein
MAGWISTIFSSGKSLVLLNGVPGRVRQEDPLCPLIFVLAANVLQSATNHAFRRNILRAPLSNDHGQDYPVVQYGDDTIVNLPAQADQLNIMKDILEQYAASVGLCINYSKSTMIPINVSDGTIQALADSIGYVVWKMPFTYLGLPLGITKPSVQDLMPMFYRTERKVTANFTLMSYTGRVTYINSLLTSIATLTMCSVKLNPKILEHYEKIRRHCLWNKKADDGDKCSLLVAWNMVCRPKNKGGVGILNLKVQNEALLLKYLHKFYNKVNTPWVKLIWDTYYREKIPHVSEACGSAWWREILKLIPVYRGISSCKVGSSETILSWKDLWLTNVLSNTHQRAFSYAIDEDMSVKEFRSAS